ncbi:tio [Drosophila busckii]|uniref:Tio n=1 Tax=Drosophila busckii TaxID=30019 RepID=A0A0M4E7B1_DROBS|nr:tio [Drosophila busckii]
MMLHEAVMLEIYRQALSASELTSPRCQSRESNASATAGEARCPSNESHCSANDCLTPAPTPTPTSAAASPVGLPLAATLAPNAAAALLPPQSAAMAAYLAAAQQNHLLLTNPLAAAASLVQQAKEQAQREQHQEMEEEEEEESPALDFSRKRVASEGEAEPEAAGSDEEQLEAAPLDLTVSARKRQTPERVGVAAAEAETPARKLPRGSDYSWVPPMNPYLAAAVGKSGANKALEKMSELSRLATPPPAAAAASVTSGRATVGGRHSAWQSHWLNKGADAAKDVFKCVWCKQSFATLALLTTHMKETQHCGVPSSSPTSAPAAAAAAQQQPPPPRAANSSSSSSSSSTGSSKSELNMLIKDQMPLPRKLVRGQDVWLGKGAEQTRQILKCMWCGQSFRSLAEMTAHMQETQHYTNIISQEQIISWKSGDERQSQTQSTATPTPPSVSAVLTCKVCEQAFGTLKELSAHMAQQSHYKESTSTSTPTPSSPPAAPPAKRCARSQRSEKRKKSLPVRKLLELERSAGSSSSSAALDSALKPLRDFAAATKITCEKCGSKIETALFVEHIRKCLGESMPIPPRRQAQAEPRLASPAGSGAAPPSVLNALEQLIEKSFESRVCRSSFSDAGTPLGASILKRLGIDDSSDYTKPLMDAQAMQLLRSSYALRDRSASESSSASRVESAYTPTPSATPTATALPPPIKSEPLESEELMERPPQQQQQQQQISVKKEFSLERQRSPSAHSERSNASPAAAAAPSATGAAAPESGSLLALNSMFDQLSGTEHNNNNNNGLCFNNNNNNNLTGANKKPKAHPLAALQKLCETTDPPASNTRSASASSAGNGSGSGSDLVAFSWACNEAVLSASAQAGAGAESIIKCAYCDTPFGSKGAYRHHLSKVHFVKDAGEDSPTLKSPAQSPKALPLTSPKRASSRSPATPAQPTPTSSSSSPYDESPQSKFLKYTELAKQLSSKNA